MKYKSQCEKWPLSITHWNLQIDAEVHRSIFCQQPVWIVCFGLQDVPFGLSWQQVLFKYTNGLKIKGAEKLRFYLWCLCKEGNMHSYEFVKRHLVFIHTGHDAWPVGLHILLTRHGEDCDRSGHCVALKTTKDTFRILCRAVQPQEQQCPPLHHWSIYCTKKVARGRPLKAFNVSLP